VVLKVLHTADWHLGRRFPSFPEEANARQRLRPRCDGPAETRTIAVSERVYFGGRATASALMISKPPDVKGFG
jgi:hypothetical protein